MKIKISYILMFLTFLVFPSKVIAWEQGTITCIYNDNGTYSNGNDSWKKYLNVTFYGVGTTMPSLGEIEYYSIYNNDLNDKRVTFLYEQNAIDYFVNFNSFIPGIESQYTYMPSILLSDVSQGLNAIKENNKELVCPSQMMVLERTIETGKWNIFVPNEIKTRYDLYACGNNYGDYNNDTCPTIRKYLSEYRKTANHDGSEGKIHTMYYYTGSLISNVGQKDPTQTNIQDVYNDTQQKIEAICKDEEDNDVFDEEECKKLQMQQGSNVNQAETNLGVSEETLKDEYLGFKADIDLDFDTTKGCESYLGNPKDSANKPPAYYLQFAFNLIKYIALILLLVLTIIEYAKAIASSNQDAIKKATMNTIKRIIIAAIIFVLPMLIEFLFKILGIYSSTTCGIK